jgi:hypothetical protein
MNMNDRCRSRLWDKETQTMYYNCYVGQEGIIIPQNKNPLNMGEVVIINLNLINKPESRHIHTFCTEIKDKNGKLIYEGDIVEYENHPYEIKWDEGCYTCWGEPVKAHEMSEASIIGNRYQNPELLTVLKNYYE